MAETNITALPLSEATSFDDYVTQAQQRGVDFDIKKSGLNDEILRRGWSLVAPYFLRPNIAPDGPLPAMPRVERDDDGNVTKATPNPQLAGFLAKAWNIKGPEDLIKAVNRSSDRIFDKAYDASRAVLQKIRQMPHDERTQQTSVVVNELAAALPEVSVSQLENEARRVLAPLLDPQADVVIPSQLPESLAGFYYASAIRQLNLGVGAGYIKPSEVRAIVAKCILGVARHHETWDDFVNALLYGEVIASGKVGAHFEFLLHNAAVLLSDPRSPWVELPLHTDSFPPIKSSNYDEVFSSMMRNATHLPAVTNQELSTEKRLGWSLQSPFVFGTDNVLDGPATHDKETKDALLKQLEQGFGINDAQSLNQVVAQYLDAPDYQPYRVAKDALQQLRSLPADQRGEQVSRIAAVLSEHYTDHSQEKIDKTAQRLISPLVLEHAEQFVPTALPPTVAAWSLSQGMRIVALGHACGFIGDDKANEIAVSAGKAAKEHYSTWREFADGFLLGRLLFVGKTDQRQQQLLATTAASVASENSPWAQLSLGDD